MVECSNSIHNPAAIPLARGGRQHILPSIQADVRSNMLMLLGAGASATVSNVRLVASDGTVDTTAVMGWSTKHIAGGGDFGITNAKGFDYHSKGTTSQYWMLNSQ